MNHTQPPAEIVDCRVGKVFEELMIGLKIKIQIAGGPQYLNPLHLLKSGSMQLSIVC